MIDAALRKETLKKLESSWREVFRPPSKLTVSEWCEQNIFLSELTGTSFPGPLDLDRTPYLREILNCLSDDTINQITCCTAAQVGKSTFQQCGLAWIIDQDPSPTLFVFPSQHDARNVVETRLNPIFNDCEAVKRHILPDRHKQKILDKHFDRMSLHFVGSTPSQVAARAIRFLFLDETDKLKEASDREASAFDNAKVRTNTKWNRKIIPVSTPTTTTGTIWREFLAGDQRKYYVPCPHAGCGAFQTLEFENLQFSEFKKDKVWDLAAVESGTWYKCINCSGRIENKDKKKMLLKGEWRGIKPRGSHASFHLSALYPPWLKFGQVALEFLKNKALNLQAFKNSWLAEPWEQIGEAAKEDEISRLICDYPPGYCPENPIAVIMTADLGKHDAWYVIRGYCRDDKSYLLRYGQVANLEELALVGQEPLQGPSGFLQVNLRFIDARFLRNEVFAFCRDNPGWMPMMGSGNQLSPTSWHENDGYKYLGINPDSFKNSIQEKIKKTKGDPGSFNLHNETGKDYLSHMTAEHVIITENKITKEQKRKWKKLRQANHLFDCESNNLAVCTAMGVRYQAQAAPQPYHSIDAPKKPSEPTSTGKYRRSDGRGYWDVGSRGKL